MLQAFLALMATPLNTAEPTLAFNLVRFAVSAFFMAPVLGIAVLVVPPHEKTHEFESGTESLVGIQN